MVTDRRRRTDPEPHPFNDPNFGRVSIGVGSMEFRKLFDQNYIRNAVLEVIPEPGSAAAKPVYSEGLNAIPYPEGVGSVPIGTDPVGMVLAIGSTIAIASSDEKSTHNAAYTLLKQIRVMKTYSGSVTIYWSHRSSTSGFTVRSKVYINGVTYGTEKTTNYDYDVEVSQVKSGGFVAGDFIQIWGKSDSPPKTIYVSMERIEYSWAVSHIGDHILSTPLAVSDTTEISTAIEDP